MYEHPYLTHFVSTVETQREERAAELRRVVAEHPERVIRREGAVSRMLRRGARRSSRPAACPAGAQCAAVHA